MLTSVPNLEIQRMVIEVPSDVTGYITLMSVVLGTLRQLVG
ncbi:hypothetical protein [Scytonema sp. HK-05]